MTNATKYYIWLSLALGYGTPKIKALRDLYPDIGELYNGGEPEWRLSGVLNQKDIAALHAVKMEQAFDVIMRCNALGINILSLDDAAYPERLKEIFDPPAVLYIKGKMPDLSRRLVIGMVGTRNATAYGKMTSHVISGALAKLGVVIVSGGAVGIDSLSHTAALETGGITLCVLGCGINYPYNMGNAKLRADIAKRGAVISEYPPDYPPGRFTFPVRNRIISGLCNGVVIVEAGEKSGSLITARCAMEQGRDVFAVMGNITSPYSKGTNALIKDGAVPVTEFSDITSYYSQFSIEGEPVDLVKPIPQHKTEIDVSEEAKRVYACVEADEKHIDVITSESGLSVKEVLQALTELELEGLIQAEKGRMYRLI